MVSLTKQTCRSVYWLFTGIANRDKFSMNATTTPPLVIL